MPAAPAPDPLGALDPAARRASPRLRVTVGAAVALFIGAVAIAAVLSFGATGGGAQGTIHPGGGGDAGGTAADPASGEVASAPLLVHVLGAVSRPGLVELDAGARVVDAVSAAGGLAADADPAGVNLARPVVDGEQLVVPVVGAVPPPGAMTPSGSSGGTAAGDGLVHLNTADVAALDTLPRIGPALSNPLIDTFLTGDFPFSAGIVSRRPGRPWTGG